MFYVKSDILVYVRARLYCNLLQNRTLARVHGVRNGYIGGSMAVQRARGAGGPFTEVPWEQCYWESPPGPKGKYSLNK